MGSTPDEKSLLSMDGWPGGVNNRIRETEQKTMREGVAIPSSQFLKEALNVDLTAEGHPIRRKGSVELETGFAHSLWASDEFGIFCIVLDGVLYFCPSADTSTAYASVSVNRYLTVSYAKGNAGIYWSNGDELGYFDVSTRSARNWGVPVGAAPANSGTYRVDTEARDVQMSRLVAVTYVDQWGLEGGASELATLDDSQPIEITQNFPAGVLEARVYASDLNSETLYHVKTIYGPTTVAVNDFQPKGEVLKTASMKSPKAGQLVAHHKGRVYIARNQTVFFTEPLNHHLMRPSQGIFMFPSYITLLQPAENGIYVGHDEGVVFLSFTDPYEVRQTHVSRFAPVAESGTRLPGKWFGQPLSELPVWWNTDGVLVLGLPDGQLTELTRDRLAVPEYAKGAVSYREQDGMAHIVSSLISSDGVTNMAANDTVVATVRTNNIVLNS
jgi:hypothetical protein